MWPTPCHITAPRCYAYSVSTISICNIVIIRRFHYTVNTAVVRLRIYRFASCNVIFAFNIRAN